MMIPGIRPSLEPDFEPLVLYNQAFIKDVRESMEAVPLIIALERNPGSIARYETLVALSSQEWVNRSAQYLERMVKFLLWAYGASRLYIGGAPRLAQAIREIYSPFDARQFDQAMMTRIYRQPFEVIPCSLDDVPTSVENFRSIGGHLDGCRVGFDLGASDVKVVAVKDGLPVFNAELEWQPGDHADPYYHKSFIRQAIQLAASHLPRLDAVGGSSAGVIFNNQPRVSSLFRAVPEDQYGQLQVIFNELSAELGVPLTVINDGEVTALAGAMSIQEKGVLGLAFGSSEAAGYVTPQGQITDHLNELAFAPIAVHPHAAIDEWSADRGVGASYLSQTAVFRLAQVSGLVIPAELSPAGRLAFAQAQLEKGEPRAVQIWESMGVYLGYALAQYADFYDIRHVLILGRCTSGRGGAIMLAKALQVLAVDFPELAESINVQLPDEKSRRVGQAIAAASLPEIH